MQPYKLFLDDIRVPTDVQKAWHNRRWEEFPSLYSWTIVRSYDQFIKTISDNGLPTVIAFDHDLAWDHYPKDDLSLMGMESINYDKFTEKTGYHCAQWLVEYCLQWDRELPDFYVHSMNPVGRTNIISLLTSFPEIRKRYANDKFEKDGPRIIIP